MTILSLYFLRGSLAQSKMMAWSITPSSYLIFFLLKKIYFIGVSKLYFVGPKNLWKSELKIKDLVNLIVKPCFLLIAINFMGLTKFKLKTIKSPTNWLSSNKSHAWIRRIENMKIVSLNLSWIMCIIALKLVLLSLKLPLYMLESQILIFKITWFSGERMSSHSFGLVIPN